MLNSLLSGRGHGTVRTQQKKSRRVTRPLSDKSEIQWPRSTRHKPRRCHAMETHERAGRGHKWQQRVKIALERDKRDGRDPLERQPSKQHHHQPRPSHAVVPRAPPRESWARSARAFSRDKPMRRCDDGRTPEGFGSNWPPGSDTGRAYVGGSTQMRGRLSSGYATAQSASSTASARTQIRPPEQPHVHVDARPVRGIVTVQALPSPTEDAVSVLLVCSRGTLVAQTLQKPYRKLLEIPLDDVAAKVMPGRENVFHVTLVDFEHKDSDPGVAGIFVVLRDCSLRDQWLEALATSGARVDVAGACLTASTDSTSYQDAPVRWLR